MDRPGCPDCGEEMVARWRRQPSLLRGFLRLIGLGVAAALCLGGRTDTIVAGSCVAALAILWPGKKRRVWLCRECEKEYDFS